VKQSKKINMSKNLLFIFLVTTFFFACKKEEDHDHNHDETTDTTYPVVTIDSPVENEMFHNGDTVHMIGLVTDNELHNGVIKIIDDTTAFEYYSYYHYVHETSSSVIDFDYVVTGVTQNSAVTITFTYDDHAEHVTVVTRKLMFMP
jgi:hypothetical protein